MLHVTVLTPERAVFDGEARSLSAPAPDGEVGILPRHAPFLCALGIGRLKVDTPDGRHRLFAVRGGFLEVLGDRVTVLAGAAALPGDIDPTSVEAEREELRTRKGFRSAEAEAARREMLAWARARLGASSSVEASKR